MKAIAKAIFSISMISLLAGCGKKFDDSQVRERGFVFCGQTAPSSFNPQLVDSGITSEVLSQQLFDSLLKLDPVTHEPVANLAHSWSANEDGTEYTFYLRENVQFQKTDWFTPTRALDASDVVFSFKRIIDNSNPFHQVGNSTYPWFSGIGFSDLIQEVEAINPHTVKFVLAQADNTFLSNIATSYAVILSKEYATRLQISGEEQNIDMFPIGTGPFYLGEYQVGDLVRLKRHNQYWRGTPEMEQIVFDISARGTGPLAKLLRKECDVLTSPLSSQIPIIKQHDELVLEANDAMNVAFVAINTEHPALNDHRVRKALSLAINRRNILDSVYYGTGYQAYSLLPPSSWAYEKDTVRLRYDRNYAVALLRESGFASGLELSMWVPLEPQPYNPSPRKTAELIQASFADIGVKLELLTSDRFNRSELSKVANIDLILTGWIASTGDPDNFLRPLLSCDAEQVGLNVSMWCNPDFDFLLDLAKETNQMRHRINLYKEAQNIMNEEVPVIPLAHGVQFQAHHRSLTGFDITPFSSQSFYQVERRQ
ncbi:peptide ABC transporter substrate-binding protein SapA [Vibrio sp. JC009]|uniref:ABC transporter substrate-binding protein SapA n=1 Tax=Vibrio sp. JC009 TaxID=2912314 RepID=UPI0023B0A493|nr:ABC transporter substrate-binding protein SapA [Vibrio sp. JC009]WED20724.1 peptide ABC transporter substrate-binding protein SapA [Vibrio sp. JC009]